MIFTGFFLWAKNLSFGLFPLWVYDIFKIVHSYEAILAFLAIIIWHLYNVHLNPEVFPMSRVWINGQITGDELRRLHPLEYRALLVRRRQG
jgi:cytochrome b subunit of formate dehydrogenase